MDDLISRQAAIDALGERPMVWMDSDYEIAQRNQYDMDKLAIETVPTVDAVPVVHGKWLYGEDFMAMCDGYRCDKCGYFVPWDYEHKFISFIEEYKYCPNCGSRNRSDE